MKANMTLFDKEVAIQAILYVAQQLKRKDIHKICKILYFADQAHLSKYGRSITGDDYIAMAYGPVPSRIEDMFKAVRGDSYFSDHAGSLTQYFSFTNKYILIPQKEADLDYLSESDIECLDAAIGKCKNKSFEELTKISHDLAWNNTQKDRNISVKDMLREVGDEEKYALYIAQKIEQEKAFM